MFGAGSRLLGSLGWFFAIAAVCFAGACGFFVWRATHTDPAYTPVADVSTFSTPASGHGRTLYLLLPDETAGKLAANEPRCTPVGGRPWFAVDFGGPSATRGGTSYSTVLRQPKGWAVDTRVVCSGIAGPGLLAVEDTGPALIMAGVTGAAALLATGFALVALVNRPDRRSAAW